MIKLNDLGRITLRETEMMQPREGQEMTHQLHRSWGSKFLASILSTKSYNGSQNPKGK